MVVRFTPWRSSLRTRPRTFSEPRKFSDAISIAQSKFWIEVKFWVCVHAQISAVPLKRERWSMVALLLTITGTWGVQWHHRFCSKWTLSRGKILSSRSVADTAYASCFCLKRERSRMIAVLLSISQTRGVDWYHRFCSKWPFSRGQMLSLRSCADTANAFVSSQKR